MQEVRWIAALLVTLGGLTACNDDLCVLTCPPAPEGCHYEGERRADLCEDVTCGKLICDDAGSDTSTDDAGAN